MDPKVYEQIRQAVAEGRTRDALLIVGITALVSVIVGFAVAFAKRKAENLATKTDFESLRAQLKENTELTETIKQELTRKHFLWQDDFEFKRRQIAECYGPLLVLVRRRSWIEERRKARMERSRKDHSGNQTEEWAEILRAFMDDYILPLRAEMVELFKTKSFLMEEWPESFTQFLRHDAEDRALYNLWRNHKNPLDPARTIDGLADGMDWPETLEEDIRRTKERLERELRAIRGSSDAGGKV